MLALVDSAALKDAVAAGATGEGEVRHHHAHRFRDADRGDGKVWPAQAKGRKADQQRGARCHRTRAQEGEEGMDACVDGQRGGIRTEAVEDGEAEGHLSREAAEQVPRHARGDPYESEEEETRDVGAEAEPRQHHQGNEQRKRHRRAPPAGDRMAGSAHARGCLFSNWLAMPPGSTISATTSRVNAMAGW